MTAEWIDPLTLSPDERAATSADRWAAVNAYRASRGLTLIDASDLPDAAIGVAITGSENNHE